MIQLQTLKCWAKNLVNFWSTNKKVMGIHVDPCTFQVNPFWPLGGAAPANVYTLYNPKIAFPVKICGAEQPQVGLCPIFLVDYNSHISSHLCDITLHCTAVRLETELLPSWDLVHGTVFLNSSLTAHLLAPFVNISGPTYFHCHFGVRNSSLVTL